MDKNNIKEQLKKHNLKQKDLAEGIGIDRPYLSNILAGRKNISKILLKAIELFFENLELKNK